MAKEMNRRESVNASLATGALVLTGDMGKGGNNLAYGAVKIPEVEKSTVTVITDNYYNALVPHYKIASRYGRGIKPGTDEISRNGSPFGLTVLDISEIYDSLLKHIGQKRTRLRKFHKKSCFKRVL